MGLTMQSRGEHEPSVGNLATGGAKKARRLRDYHTVRQIRHRLIMPIIWYLIKTRYMY